jgi:hypothetical protein
LKEFTFGKKKSLNLEKIKGLFKVNVVSVFEANDHYFKKKTPQKTKIPR